MVSVAVYGINGLLGKDVINGLLTEPFVSKIDLPIRLVTSDVSKKPVPDSDKVKYISYKEVPFTEAFKGVDVVINLSNPDLAPIKEVLAAVVANKVKLYIPSQFGTDLEAADADFPGFLDIKTSHSKEARSQGIKTIDIITGLFIAADEKFLGQELSVLKFNPEKKEVELLGDENTLINPSFYADIGKVVASVATFGDYSKLPNKVRTYSDRVTLGDLVAHYEKVNGVKLTTTKRSTSDIVTEAQEKYKKGFSFADFFLYLQTFVAQGEGKGIVFEKENERELVNPNESLFKWTKYVI